MNLPLDPTELAMLMNNGYFGVSDDILQEIAETMRQHGLSLSGAAWACDIDPGNLSASDESQIREYYRELEEEEEEE